MKSWKQYFVELAQLASTKSKDRSTKVGAVIIGPNNEIRTTGYNGFPRKVNDDVEARHSRPTKYLFTEHAERNAIYNAARHGIALDGCTLYLNYVPCPCADCTRAIIQSGIVKIIGPRIKFPGKGELWEESMRASTEMLDEAGVIREYYDVEVENGPLQGN